MPLNYKPPMSPKAFVGFFVVFVLGAFGVIWVYDPPVAGEYHGLAEDLPMGALGPMELTLQEVDGKLIGQVTLPPSMLEGGGALTGTVDNSHVVFVTTDAGGRKMTWTGGHAHNHLSGSYWWGELDEQGRRATPRLGRWSAEIE